MNYINFNNEFHNGNIHLYQMDCMELLKQTPDKYYHLACVDPPYGIKDDGRNHMGRVFKKDGSPILKRDKRNGSLISVKPQGYKLTSRYDDKQPNQKYFDEIIRVSDKQIIWGENYIQFEQKNTSSGRIVWDKVNGESDQSDCEIAWTNFHSSVRLFSFMWSGMLQGKSVLEGKISQGNNRLKESRIHPNHKPTALYRWLLHNYAKPGDRILDTHGGSRSLAIACHDYGFGHVSCELDADYHRDSVKRFNNHIMQGRLL